MNLLKKKVTKEVLFREYTNILNGVLQLSPREAEVLYLLFDSKTRKEILNTAHISAANLSKYLRVLKGKGLLVRNEKGKWVINDILKPNIVNNKIELSFVLEIE
jgi:predicted transcriptional regulator